MNFFVGDVGLVKVGLLRIAFCGDVDLGFGSRSILRFFGHVDLGCGSRIIFFSLVLLISTKALAVA